jgi:hypothetical protein
MQVVRGGNANRNGAPDSMGGEKTGNQLPANDWLIVN